MRQLLQFYRKQSFWINRISVFGVAIVLIMLIFPREGKFKFEFQRGKPWMHEDLIAPFDFSIQKTTSELAQERESIQRRMKPFFRFKPEKSAQQRILLIADLQQKMMTPSGELPADYLNLKNLALQIFDQVHETGIVELNPVLEGQPPDFPIMVIRNNTATDVELNKLFNIRTADQLVKDQLKKINNPAVAEMLLRLISGRLVQNVLFDKTTTEREIQNTMDRISVGRGMIQKGERIISKGELINSEKLQTLESFRNEYEQQIGSTLNYFGIVIGQGMLVTISLTVLFLFLLFFRPAIFRQDKNVVIILLIILLMIFLISFVVRNHLDYLYMLPVCLVPILIRVFYDTRVALFVHLVVIIITGFLVPNSFEFVFLQLIAGIIAIMSVVQVTRREQFLFSAFLIFLTYSAIYSGLNLMQDGNFSTTGTKNYMMFAGSALITLLAYPLVSIFEKTFGIITDLTLLELSDTNNELLRKMAEVAPGTFQHSIQLANIAEEVIREIGGNPLLVRVGALYHDIGKTDMPLYFIENQATGVNPHDELSFDESARIIVGHVQKGIEMARKKKLPESITDFIRMHHGTKKVEYFYSRYLETKPDDEAIDESFAYRGPVPFSKETAVVMMADSVEAASRSIKSPDFEKIDKLVESVINKQLTDGQYDNSEITIRDIYLIKKILKKKLMNIYHIRVSYR